MDCAIARSLEILGEWWTLLIIREAFMGVRRFDDMQSHLGIARNVLTNRLATLVEHGILTRELYQQKPPRYEYRLTEKGLDLYPILLSLMKWGERWVGGKSATVLIHKSCGQRVSPEFRCQHCNETLSAKSIRPEFDTVAQVEAVK
jgi:DNA-binding HxlR family transcriptional regulator